MTRAWADFWLQTQDDGRWVLLSDDEPLTFDDVPCAEFSIINPNENQARVLWGRAGSDLIVPLALGHQMTMYLSNPSLVAARVEPGGGCMEIAFGFKHPQRDRLAELEARVAALESLLRPQPGDDE